MTRLRNGIIGAVYALSLLATALAAPSNSGSPFADPLFRDTPVKITDNTNGNVLATPIDVDGQMRLLGYQLIEEGHVGAVETKTWLKGGAVKRQDTPAPKLNIEGGRCATECGYSGDTRADPSDCEVAYKALYQTAHQFSLDPHVVKSAKFGNCSSYFVNNSDKTLVYDYWDMGGTAQWLNGNCVIQSNATIGTCRYEAIGTGYADGAYTSVNNPNYFMIQ